MSEGESQPWNGIDISAHRWEPAELANAPAMDIGRKESGRKRMESVFAQSSYQPQQMHPNNGKGSTHIPQGYLPSAYQSLPSDVSGQMTFPSGSLHGSHTLRSSGSMYPSIDHTTESIANQFAYLDRTGGAQGFQSGPSNGFTIQCGRFNAPIQRESMEAHGTSFPPLSGHTLVAQPEKMRRVDDVPFSHPLQLQEYYTAQSDILEGLMRNNRAMQQHMQNTSSLVGQGGEMEGEFMDSMGYLAAQAPMHRANSALEALPQPPNQSHYPSLEPYMPQWSSESVPAELPNHVVNRLLMRGQPPSTLDRFSGGSLSGSKRPGDSLSGLPPIHFTHQTAKNKEQRSSPNSPNVKDLEEIARTADAEVAHRAFLVPAHKKRGKGGRQPAADPRLDPSIDERKAKRILANRLSAAKSKMKQKNQAETMGKMVSELEQHRKLLQNDAAELMELCEKLELQNRRMSRDQKILEEYLARADRGNAQLAMAQRHMNIEMDRFM